MAHRVLQALDDLARELGIAVLTPEFRILVALLAEASHSPEELCAISGLSRSGFFHTIDRLKHWQFVSFEPDPADRRRTRYALTPRAAESILGRLRQFRHYTRFAPPAGRDRETAGPDGKVPERVTSHRPRWRGDQVTNITCECQVLVFLYAEPGATSGEIAAAMSASPTKFHAALARLVAEGLVVREDDGTDRRRKRHFLSQWVHQAQERANQRIFARLDEIPDGATGGTAPPAGQPTRLSAGLGSKR